MRIKTRKLHHFLEIVFPDTSMIFPTGPVPLLPNQFLGKPYDGQTLNGDTEGLEAYAWFSMYYHYDPPNGLYDTFQLIAHILKTEGPFDGIMGFSQGSAICSMVASILEGQFRKQAFDIAKLNLPSSIPFPSMFENLDHPPFKFGITFGGAIAESAKYDGFYKNPCIATPFCHFIGQYDSVVDSLQTMALIRATGGPDKAWTFQHHGAHFIPTDSKSLEYLVSFILQATSKHLNADLSLPLRYKDLSRLKIPSFQQA